MAPKRDAAWAADRAAKYQRKAFSLNYSSQGDEIRSTLVAHPHSIPQLRNALVDMGLLPPLGMRPITSKVAAIMDAVPDIEHQADAAVVNAPSSSTQPAAAPARATASQKSTPKDIAVIKVNNKIVPPTIHTNLMYFVSTVEPDKSLQGHVLMHILSQTEAGVLGLCSMNALSPGRRRVIPLQIIQELFEFVFDLGPTAKIPETWRTLTTCIDELNKLNVANGRLALTITLPPNWVDAHGHYCLRNKDTDLTILSRKHDSGKLDLTKDLLGLPASADMSRLELSLNFSKQRAVLTYRGSFSEWAVLTLFASAERHGKPAVGTGGRRISEKKGGGMKADGQQQKSVDLVIFGKGGGIVREELMHPPKPQKGR
jgi:hypothetical protein